MNNYLEDYVSLILDDGLGNMVELSVSPDDAERAGRDLEFAQTLMATGMSGTSQTETVQPGPSSSDSTSSTTTESFPQEAIDGEQTEVFKWPHRAIMLLVETYRMYEEDFKNGKVSQKKTWEKISKLMRDNGYTTTGPQCMSKFSGMKRTYKSISDHNNKSGNNARTWPYFETMQSLLGDRPFMEPPAIASSSGRVNSSSETNSETHTPSSTPRLIRAKKSRASEDMSQLSEALLESRRIAEEGRNRRHQELMAGQQKLMEKLDLILDKL